MIGRLGRSKWRGVAVVAVAIVAVVTTSCFVYSNTLGYWARLHAVTDDFPAPSGFRELAVVKEGSAFCVISCSPARVTLVFNSSMDPEETCDVLRTHLDRHVGEPRDQPYLSWCGFEVQLMSVGDGAYAQPGAEVGSTLRASGPSWSQSVEVDTGSTIAWVEFNSGLD